MTTLLRGWNVEQLTRWERFLLAFVRARWTEDAVTGELLAIKPWRGGLYIVRREPGTGGRG